MKSWDVLIESAVNVKLPDDLDPDSPEGIDRIYELAIPKFRSLLLDPAQIALKWERYKEGDNID